MNPALLIPLLPYGDLGLAFAGVEASIGGSLCYEVILRPSLLADVTMRGSLAAMASLEPTLLGAVAIGPDCD